MEDQQLHPDYKKGFNDAWRLSEEMPQLFDGLKMPGEKTNEYCKGFDDGRMQYVKEHQLDQIRQRRENNQQRGLER